MFERWWPLAVVMTVTTPLVMGCDALSGLFDGGSDDDDDDNDDADARKRKKKKAKVKQAEAPAPALDPFIVRHLELGRQAAQCDGAKPVEPWCSAAKGFAAGSPGKPTTRSFLGMATFVQTKGATAATLSKHQHLASLSFRADDRRTFAFIAKVSPDNATERLEVQRVEGLLAQWFTGGSPAVRVSPGMGGYLDGLPAKSTYEAMAHANGYTVKGGSNAELRRVGEHWVAVEVPRKDAAGIWLSVFHDTTYR